MFETVTCEEELQGLIIEKIDKITMYAIAKDDVTDKERKIQIVITDCNNPEICIEVWKEVDKRTKSSEEKRKLSIECSDYNMEIKKDNNKDNLFTYLWKLSNGD